MTPSHAVFRTVFKNGLQTTERTFDYLPDAETQYPFIFVGENSNVDEPNADLIGEVTQTIHIYATRTQRSELDNLASRLLNLLKTSRSAYEYSIMYQSHNQQDISDNTDVVPLIHRVIDIKYFYNKKGSKLNDN